jgi:DNA-binding beta-propeller fold protein YncE
MIGSVVILAGLSAVGIGLAGPSDAQSPSFHVFPPNGPTFNQPVAVSSDGTHVWVANKNGNSVTEFDATTGALVQMIQGAGYGFDGPDAVSSNGTDVWVANSDGNSVTELDATTGALVRVISAGTPPSSPAEFSPNGQFDFPTGITAAGAEVWVLNNNGDINSWSVTELDAATGAIVKVIHGPTNADTSTYMGISSDGTDVWVTNAGYWTGPTLDQVLTPGFITEYDASTGAVVQVIEGSTISPYFSPDAVSSDGTDVWVANIGGGSVAELSASTGALVRLISLSSYGNAVQYVSSDGTDVWVGFNAELVELDATTGALVREISEPGDGFYADYQKLASDGTHLWVVNTTNQSLIELDASTGSLVQIVPVSAYGFDDPIAASSDGTHVWVANMQNDSVSELDASTGNLVRVLSGPSYDFGFGDFSGEADAISSDGIHVWVANPDTDSITELNASTGALVRVIPGPSRGEPFAVSSDGAHVWVTDTAKSSVTELNASTGAVMRVMSDSTFGFDEPWAVSSDGTHVWVASFDNSTVTELSATTGALVHVNRGVFATTISSDGTHAWAAGGTSVTEFSDATGALVQTIPASAYGLEFTQAISSDGTDVWVAGTGDNAVIELNASTGAVVQAVSGSSYGFDWPDGISADGTDVWVTNQYANTVTALSTGVQAQRIIFTSTPPSDPLVGGAPYTVSAMGAASGNPVTFSIDPSAASVCSISGQTVSFSTPGTCIVDANQAAGNGYVAAPQAQQSFVVGAQSITFTSAQPYDAAADGAPYYLGAVGGGSGNPVTFSSDDTSVCSVSGSTVSFHGAGWCDITANQAGNADYLAAPPAFQSFLVGAAGTGGSGGSGGFVVMTTSVPGATAGVKFAAFVLQASGASAPYKWTLAGGALPRGLHLRSNGTLSGKPSRGDAGGTYTFTVEASSHHRHPLLTTPTETLTLTLQASPSRRAHRLARHRGVA